MKPYYAEAGITIYCGDCREILPGLPKVDLVLTDPPYGINYQSNHRAVKHALIVGDSDLPLDTISYLIDKSTRAAYFFCRWDQLPVMPPPKSVIAWVKNNWSMGDLQHEHGRQWEACCFYPKEQHEFITRIPDVIVEPRTNNELHPTQKPTNLISRIIGANVGEVVLDPWMGSGTAMLSARAMGRRAIGIEIEERYCEIAANRLRQGVLWGLNEAT